jgi:hypothetical protein
MAALGVALVAMRRWGPVFGTMAFALAVGQSAHAGPLASASLVVTLPTLAFAPAFPGVAVAGTATSSTSATLGAGSAFAGVTTETLTPIEASFSPVDKIRWVLGKNGGGGFFGTVPSKVGGTALFTGHASLYATEFAPTPFFVVPFKIGKATSLTVMGTGLAFSVLGAPWTAGKAVVTGVQLTGSVLGSFTVTGMNALSPAGGGTLTLVSPGKLYVSVGFKLPLISTLTLNYVPEPGTASLLGAGALGLAFLGRPGRRD